MGPQADLYAVGGIAYEMLTGKLPFDTEDPIEQIAKRLSEVPRRAATVARVPAELDDIVMRLLARQPEDRPASAGVVRQQLAKYRRNLQNESTVMGPRPLADADGPATLAMGALTPVPPQGADRPTRRVRKGLAFGFAATGLVLLLGVVAAVVFVPRGPKPGPVLENPDQPRPVVPEPDAPPEVPKPRGDVARPDSKPKPLAVAKAPAPSPSPIVRPVPSPLPTEKPPVAKPADPIAARRASLLARLAALTRTSTDLSASNRKFIDKIAADAKAAQTLKEIEDQEGELEDFEARLKKK